VEKFGSACLLLLYLISVSVAANESTGVDSETAPTEVEQRELEADEDPMSASGVERDVERSEEPDIESQRTVEFGVYGSVRVRYRDEGEESGLQDGSSRVGIELDWKISPETYFFGRYEWGFDLLTGLDPDQSIGELQDTIFDRLRYIGFDSPNANIVVGKNWSPYYAVAAFTDRFEGTGGNGSGVFNALTDGGATGTGRADQAIQGTISTRFLPHSVFKPFDLNLQIQQGNSIPFGEGVDYGTAIGASAVLTTQKNFTIGLAYNYADIDIQGNPSLASTGISGSARAILVGTRAFGDRWYAGFTFSNLKNHETTDQGIYFDGWGSEFYGQYRLTEHVWLIGGYNALEPDSDQAQAGDFRVRYEVLGLRYSFKDFKQMIWANIRFDDGYNAVGSPAANVYTVGLRWDLSRRWQRAFRKK
jgi:hypothetical protein